MNSVEEEVFKRRLADRCGMLSGPYAKGVLSHLRAGSSSIDAMEASEREGNLDSSRTDIKAFFRGYLIGLADRPSDLEAVAPEGFA